MKNVTFIVIIIFVLFGFQMFGQNRKDPFYIENPRLIAINKRIKVKVKLNNQEYYLGCNNELKSKKQKKCLEDKINQLIRSKLDSTMTKLFSKLYSTKQEVLRTSEGKDYVHFTFKMNKKNVEITLKDRNKVKISEKIKHLYKNVDVTFERDVLEEATVILLKLLPKLELGKLSGHIIVYQIIRLE